MLTNIKIAQNETMGRIVIALLLLPLLAVLAFGGKVALALVLVFLAIMMWELLASVGRRYLWAGLAFVSFVCPIVLAMLSAMLSAVLWVQVVAWAVAGGVALAFFPHISGVLLALLLVLLGVVLVGLFTLADAGTWLVLCLMTVAMVDIMGYMVGRTIGGVRLCPSISPAKTWSGAVAGFLASPLPFLLYFLWVDKPLGGAWFGFAFGFVSICGDLLESWFKRRHGIKDISSLLLGHGGLLDRFDGSLMAVPLLYVLLVLGWLG